MKPFLFAFAALIVLIPILFVLPLGFNRRGNVIIIAVSFFLASFSILAKSTFPFWQVVLLLLLLALSITYLLDKKLGHLLYVRAQEQEIDAGFPQTFAQSLPARESEEDEEKTMIEEQWNNKGQHIEEISEEPMTALLDKTESLLESEQQNDVEHMQSAGGNQDEDIEVDEEIQFLENRLQWLEQSSEPLANYAQEPDYTGNLNEIETWLESVNEEEALEDVISHQMNASESETLMEEPNILMDDDFIPELNFADEVTDIDVDKQGK
ncbi:hypothetical protein [Bacillus alveayuensis]|uniref:hypothetical protein n=1 Tax=Aeribacillus alveayuensis TaxID=279215 RepID=UPI0005D11E39|nr:hypothetical protein [Bacillus alveayuensis]